MSATLAWGIIGTGAIARTFAKGLARSRSGLLTAVGSRTRESADKFGEEFDLPAGARHAGYEALLADERVQAVYISTPHPMHAEWAIRAAEAGKHILCEKPIGLNAYEAMAIIEAAREHDVFLMEAFMYRCHPQTARIVELVKSGAIGQVRLIQATFSFHWPRPLNTESRLTNHDLGGGGILDVGCYTVSFARLIAGAATGQPFADPCDLKAAGHVGPVSRCDEYAAALLTFAGKGSGVVSPNATPALAGDSRGETTPDPLLGAPILAQVATGVQLNQDSVARIYGTEGHLYIPNPWVPAREGGTTRIILTRHDGQPSEEIEISTDEHLYGLEADTVAAHLAKRQAASPAMSWDDTLGNMKTLDAWRLAIGMVYDSEKPAGQTRPVSGRPLTFAARSGRSTPAMKYGSIPGLDKQASRLVLGVDNQRFMPHASVMFDDFFERGGNVFDTAHIYGPDNEGNLGHWIKNRGVREQVVILDKGAHTPYCNPTDLVRQHHESLQRLQTEYVDLYLMHRDNPQVPVGEFVEVLNELKAKGSIRAFGGSNWSLRRVEEANEYARSKGLTPFVAVSNQFSLARMVDPVWGGCIAASDAASRAWFERQNGAVVLMPWSSQARGFFTPRGADPNDAEMKRCWHAEDNFNRRDRAIELAKQKGVEPIVIALAYVLCQPFPTFPLIGPRQLSETRSSLQALVVELTPDELRWLNLET